MELVYFISTITITIIFIKDLAQENILISNQNLLACQKIKFHYIINQQFNSKMGGHK